MEEKVRYKQGRTEGIRKDVMETTGAVTPNGEPLWSVETVGAALKDARDRGLVILGGDVFDEKMRETEENWCYQSVWTPSYSEFSKTSSENSFRRAEEYVKLWAGENVYFSLVVQDVTEAYIYAAGR